MKKWVLIAAMMVIAGAVQAYDLGLYGSYWEPDEADEAVGIGGSMLFDTLPLELRVTLYPDMEIPRAGDTLVLPVEFGLAANLTRAESVDVYAGAGLGYYIIDADRGDPDNELGWYLLGRAEIPLDGRMNLFGGVMYRGVEVDDIDIDLSGVTVNVGFIFR